MSANQATTLFTAPPTTLFAVLCTTFSILFRPVRKLYLQLILVLHIVVSPFYIINVRIENDNSVHQGGGLGALMELFLLWLFFTVLVAPFLFTYLFGELIYGVRKVYAGEVQPTLDSKWIKRISRFHLGIVFLYALIVMGICIGLPYYVGFGDVFMHGLFIMGLCIGSAYCVGFGFVFSYALIVMGICSGSAYCIGLIFETINELPGWNDWNPTNTKSQLILSLILYTLKFMLVIPLAGMLLVAFIAVLFERDISFKERLHTLCKENFRFIYSKFLGYIFSVMLLLALSLQLTKPINDFASELGFVYWWMFVLMFPAITTILPIVLYMSIRVRNEELTQESFAYDIDLSGSGDLASPLIPQGDEPSQETDANWVGMTSSHSDSSHINEGE